MSNLSISKLWLKMPNIFDPVQKVFNGNLWKIINEKFEPFAKGKVLDIACGTGELRKHINPRSYLGVDINKSYISHAQKHFLEKNTKFIYLDITTQLPQEAFDTVFFISAAHHLSDVQLDKLFKLIKKQNINNFILIDDMPTGPMAKLLTYLDARLGGGKYFRSEDQLTEITRKYFQILQTGSFTAQLSFYRYPYVIAKIH